TEAAESKDNPAAALVRAPAPHGERRELRSPDPSRSPAETRPGQATIRHVLYSTGRAVPSCSPAARNREPGRPRRRRPPALSEERDAEELRAGSGAASRRSRWPLGFPPARQRRKHGGAVAPGAFGNERTPGRGSRRERFGP